MRFPGFVLLALVLSACAGPRPESEVPVLAFAPEQRIDVPFPGEVLSLPKLGHGLAGRTLRVDSVEDIVLLRNEVILTFDDGPVPGKTTAILDTLDAHGVKATFLMVGEMAQSYPHLVREVARRGHTIGSHTQNHRNLASMSFEGAVAEVRRGETSIAAALIPAEQRAAPFFRFPYLASTAALRRHLAARGVVVIDVDIDSKDYFVSTPAQVRERALAKIEKKGSGIVLFHDLHARTAAMLPGFLDELDARGYKVVRLVPGNGPTLTN